MNKRNIIKVLVAITLLLILVSSALAQSSGELREEFHQTYPLTANGQVSLENINGAVHITAWDRNEVRVDAIKRAYTPERLAEAKINVDATPDAVRIKTQYPFTENSWRDKGDNRYRNPASVEYTLTVPRHARLESIELINGALDINGVAGDVKASSINGVVSARGLAGEAKLSTINGKLEATFDRLDELKSISLSSVNGSVVLTIPSDSSAHLKANTVHGAIINDFGLPVRRGEYVGHDLEGRLGQGSARIRLNNVNGRITIQHPSDGRPPSPVTNLLSEARKAPAHGEFEMRIQREVSREVERALRGEHSEITREVERATREAQREVQRATRETQRTAREAARESQRIELEARRNALEDRARIRRGDARLIDRESKTFAINGVPNITAKTFDGPITVRAWEQSNVMFTATKRAGDEQAMRGIQLRADQQGNAVSIVAEFDKSAQGQWGTNASVELDVYVPRNANLQVSSGDGRLRLEGINGEADLRTGDGSVDVRDGRGRLRVNTGDGRILISNFDGAAEARTGDGRITLDGRFTQLAAQTGDGSISLSLPADVNATVETNTVSVVNDGLAVAEDTDSAKRVRRWRVGSGGSVFTLRTGDGQIILRRADASKSNATAQ